MAPHPSEMQEMAKVHLNQVAHHFNLHDHSSQNVTVYGLSLHPSNAESRKKYLKKEDIFQIGTQSH